jgi:hypothetical protein
MSGYGCPDFVNLFDVLKAGKIMTEQKFEPNPLSLWWLTATCCAEKYCPPTPDKRNKLRLFKG